MNILSRALRRADPPASGKKRINLALQGGGAHGAFTWGVLDELLSDSRIEIEGISGTSAGAINAVMVADGLARGGPEEARKRLADFWRAASRDGEMSTFSRAISERLFSPIPIAGGADEGLVRHHGELSVALRSQSARHQSAEGPHRPLRRFRRGEEERDAAVHRGDQRAHRTAAGFPARQDRRRRGDGLGALPYVFKAVEIDGVPFWDGGYMANPLIFPFFRTTEAEDVLLVQINPVRGVDARDCSDIVNRINEITLNASLLANTAPSTSCAD